MEGKILIRVEGTTVSKLSVERQDDSWGLVVQDPIYGSFPASGLKLEISQDNRRWYPVTEHELVALLVS